MTDFANALGDISRTVCVTQTHADCGSNAVNMISGTVMMGSGAPKTAPNFGSMTPFVKKNALIMNVGLTHLTVGMLLTVI